MQKWVTGILIIPSKKQIFWLFFVVLHSQV